MEAELASNHSSTDFTDVSNLINFTTESTSIEKNFKWTNEEIARLIQIIVRPILIVVGTTGNCTTFYIMRKTSLKDLSSCFYMSVLALADTGKYVTVISNQYRNCLSFSI